MLLSYHACIRTADPEKGREFYEALGLSFSRTVRVVRDQGRPREATEDEIPGVTNYWFGIGDNPSVLELMHEHDGRAFEPAGHVGIFVDNLDATLDRLSERGFDDVVNRPYQPMISGGPFMAFVRDPDGNLIELSAGRE